MSGNKLIHFTNILHLPSIINDGLLRREGHNIEKFIEQIDSGIISADQVKHPSGYDIQFLWRAMKRQYRLVGRYVWLTEENDVRCISAQRNFEKAAVIFDAETIQAKRWVDVMRIKSQKSNKALKLIKHLNQMASNSGDDITRWWVVDEDIQLNSCECIVHSNKLAA